MRNPDAARPWLAGPAVHIETLVLVCAGFLMLSGNGPFWRATLADRSLSDPGTWFYAGAVFVGALIGTTFGTTFSLKFIQRALGLVLLIAGAKLIGVY